LGSSDGQGTEYLIQSFERTVAVDGSSDAISALRKRFAHEAGLETVHSYFADLKLKEEFDTVIAAHVLEHVDDPAAVLAVAKNHLSRDGVLIVDVPNARSIHRQAGVEMGLLNDITDLNEADLSIGHKRVYTPEALRLEIEAAGLRIKTFGGVFLKFLSNAQTERLLDEEQQRALLELGKKLPELASEIYVVAVRR
jgi:2-polyprenyl-3-methyl-5-hydroxy-6-metoxy-1,4-benzoquinol methylase